jgi:hypothetical protein
MPRLLCVHRLLYEQSAVVNVALVGWINESLVWVPLSEGVPGGLPFEIDFKGRSKALVPGQATRHLSWVREMA